jgi:beta-lactamase regulating signal transducer with metallopeptidase domain/HEAT repeat protein
MTMRLVGWAIVHSLWQGGLFVLVSAGLLALTRRSRPVVRYGIALATLTAMVVVPVTTAILTAGAETESGYGSSLTSTQPDASAPASLAADATPRGHGGSSDIRVGDVESFSVNGGVVSNWVETSLPFLVAAWMLGLLVASGRLIGGFARTRTVSRKSTSPASRSLEIRVEKLCERLGITRAIRLLESTNIDVPLVIGAVRPVIVVPLSLVTGLTPVQLDMLLAHELAHVRRHDYLINLVQTVFETLLFYHPGARWISERAREEREHCCDDIAIEACGVNARDYTETLLVLEEARDQGFGLAAAATGGSLLRRAQRLLSGRPAYLELGPRWMAGVITIGAGLFASNDAFAAIRAAYLPVAAVAVDRDSVEKGKRVDTSRAKPSTVIKSPATGSLSDRARWAEKNSGSNDYWIGYLIAGDPSGRSRYYTSELPVRLEGNVTMSGSMTFGNGDVSGMLFYGTPLAPLVGNHAPLSTAIFLRMHEGALGRSVEQIHFGTFSLPGYFGNRPLVWLDSATDAESIALLRSVFGSAGDKDVRENIVAAIGAHRTPGIAVPVLLGILDSRDAEDVRRRAAEAIGRTGDPRAMTILARAARNDRTEGVRRESIEAFGHMQSPAATDTLIAFVNTLDDSDLRRVAIEALGHREDDKAFNFLARFVKGSDSYDVRREAIEALANMPDGRGMNAVIDIAQHDPNAEMRRQAVESIGELEPASRAFDLLKQIVATDPDESVQSEAVETIASVHDARSVAILSDIIEHHSSARVQAEAVESLGETVAPEAALPILRKIVRDHPASEARKKALEALISLHDEKSAIDEIVHTIRNDPSEDVRDDALDALGDAKDPAALKTLESIINGSDRLEIRQKALEVYADAVTDKDAVAMLKRVMANDKSMDMRGFAAELLKDR